MSLTDELSQQRASLATLKAAEIELTDGADAALKVLGTPTDAIRMRATLGILIRSGRHQVAADIIGDEPPDENWVDVGAFIFAFIGNTERAAQYVRRADDSSDSQKMRQTRLGFTEGVVERWRAKNANGSLLAIRTWPEADISLARTVIETLDPLLSLVRANRRIGGEFDAAAVTYAIYSAHISGNAPLIKQCAGWLVKYKPIPLIVAELCLRGMIPCPEGLPGRLRFEHAGDFQAAFVAALVERELQNRPTEAFDALVRLSNDATTDDEKEAVCVALFETCGRCDPERSLEAKAVVATLRPADSRLLALLQTGCDLATGDLTKARERLVSLRGESDGVWWQAYAHLCEREGDEDAAQHAWEKASELLPHPEVVRRSVQASLDRRRFESAVRGLKKLVAETPNSPKELKALAWALNQLGDYAQAAKYLAELVEIEPSNAEYRLGLAQCLGRSARIGDGIKVLQMARTTGECSANAIYLESELLEADGRAAEAFELVKSMAADHWDDPHFLMTYMRRGNAAGQDVLAHEAFARLIELRRGGKVPAEMLQQGTLEQLLEYGREYRTRRESLQNDVVGGRMPWLFADDVLGNPPIWAWTLRTQKLAWLSEEPLSRAAYTVYASNAFTVCATPHRRHLERISASGANVEVVADLSALITLHELGELEHAADFFGRIILPASYGELQMRDSQRFGLHQPSRDTELKTIRGALDRQRIRVAEADVLGLAVVDEYASNPVGHAYSLSDFLGPLNGAQKVSREDLEDLRKVAQKPSTIDATHPGFAVGAHLLVALSTLRTLANRAVFEPILDTFSIFLLAQDRDELVTELRAYETARAARQDHDALWNTVSALVSRSKIQWHPVPKDTELDDDSVDETVPSVHLDALKVARQTGKSIIVDDRVHQVIMYQDDTSSTTRAFGSDRVIESLAESGICSVSEAAAKMRALMRWRYRFLVPSPKILYQWALEGIDNLPGDALLDSAIYHHDCLRDPGLHCGLEQSDPPMPMAAKYVTGWTEAIVTFLATVWADLRFHDESATKLTRWVAEEMVSSCPKGLWLHQIGHNIATAATEATIKMAMVQFTGIEPLERANTGIRVLADALGLDDSHFLAAVAEAIHEIER